MTLAHEPMHRSRWNRASARAAAIAVRTTPRPVVQRALEPDEQSDTGPFGKLPQVAAFSSCQALLVACVCPPGPCRCGCVLE